MGCMRPYFKKLGAGKRRVESWPEGQDGSRVLGSEDMFSRPHCSQTPSLPAGPHHAVPATN